MPGSGAGLNRVGQYGGVIILANINTGTATVSTPTTGYGTIGSNDSGAWMIAADGYTKWTFQLVGSGTGYSVSIYGTISDALYPNGIAAANGSTLVAAADWDLLPGPSEQGGTGGMANPLTSTNPWLFVSGGLVAVRAVLTTSSTPSGTVSVRARAVP